MRKRQKEIENFSIIPMLNDMKIMAKGRQTRKTSAISTVHKQRKRGQRRRRGITFGIKDVRAVDSMRRCEERV